MKTNGKFKLAIVTFFVCATAFSQSQWEGKTITTYGNSITAIGNGNHTAPYNKSTHTPWQIIIADHLKFAQHCGRGVGGQRFTWNTGTWWANDDGTYNSRPNGIDEQPEGTTEHLGAFCSWDRITTMVPQESDIILIMGGTNDLGSPIGEMIFSDTEKTDKKWAESKEYIGDFNINCFKGGGHRQ